MQNIDDAELLRRIRAAAASCENSDKPYFSSFLTQSQYLLLQQQGFSGNIKAIFSGGEGNLDPERVKLALIPDYFLPEGYTERELCELIGIEAVCFRFRERDKLSHRDILGAVMSLGLKRDVIGDIYCIEGAAVVYVNAGLAQFICDNISVIGKTGVTATIGLDFEILPRQYTEIKASAASLRLDNIVKCAAGCSRTVAVDKYIKPQLVQLCGSVCDNPSRSVKQGDILSIRGKGKYVLAYVGAPGRKGNISILLKKYV